jgi:hypothetical protein
MFKFSKKEIIGIFAILVFIAIVTYLNILISYRNDRDVRRNLDITAISVGVEKYFKEYGVYPLSAPDGKILACKGELTGTLRDENGIAVINEGTKKAMIKGYVPCRWGEDALQDVSDLNYPKYLDVIPADPQSARGMNYFYVSDGRSYKILTSYEGKSLKDYSQSVLKMNINCGIRKCNAGRTQGARPL